jgi:hypothetical protein
MRLRIGASRSHRVSIVTVVVATLALGFARPAHAAVAEPATSPLYWSGAFTTDPSGAPSSISCASRFLCVAVDENGDVVSATNPFAEPRAWNVTAVPGSATATTGGISCVSTPICVAVGNGELVTSSDPTGGAAAWKVEAIDGEARLNAVSCVLPSLCVAVDSRGKVLTTSEPAAGAAGWKMADINGEAALADVSCASPSLCAATDGHGNVWTSTEPTGGSGAWSSAHIGAGPLHVSCVVGPLCVATVGANEIASSTDPTGGASAWQRSKVEGTGGLISCASASLCAASEGGTNSGLVASADPTGGASAWVAAGTGARIIRGLLAAGDVRGAGGIRSGDGKHCDTRAHDLAARRRQGQRQQHPDRVPLVDLPARPARRPRTPSPYRDHVRRRQLQLARGDLRACLSRRPAGDADGGAFCRIYLLSCDQRVWRLGRRLRRRGSVHADYELGSNCDGHVRRVFAPVHRLGLLLHEPAVPAFIYPPGGAPHGAPRVLLGVRRRPRQYAPHGSNRGGAPPRNRLLLPPGPQGQCANRHRRARCRAPRRSELPTGQPEAGAQAPVHPLEHSGEAYARRPRRRETQQGGLQRSDSKPGARSRPLPGYLHGNRCARILTRAKFEIHDRASLTPAGPRGDTHYLGIRCPCVEPNRHHHCPLPVPWLARNTRSRARSTRRGCSHVLACWAPALTAAPRGGSAGGAAGAAAPQCFLKGSGPSERLHLKLSRPRHRSLATRSSRGRCLKTSGRLVRVGVANEMLPE